MNADYICAEVEKACIKAGADRTCARNAGMKVADDWRKNKYTCKLSKLIEQAVKDAVKLTKKYNKGIK